MIRYLLLALALALAALWLVGCDDDTTIPFNPDTASITAPAGPGLLR